MQKIFAILIVFFACTAFGARSAARLRQRATFLAALETALRRFLLAMEYEKKPLERLASKRVYGEAQPLFDAFAEALSAGARPEAAMRQAVQGTKDGAHAWLPLGDAEAALLSEFAAIVGTPSAGRYAVLQRLHTAVEAAGAEERGKGRAYRATGMLSGAAIAILML